MTHRISERSFRQSRLPPSPLALSLAGLFRSVVLCWLPVKYLTRQAESRDGTSAAKAACPFTRLDAARNASPALVLHWRYPAACDVTGEREAALPFFAIARPLVDGTVAVPSQAGGIGDGTQANTHTPTNNSEIVEICAFEI